MTYDALDSKLRSMINRFGYERVEKSLREIGHSESAARGVVPEQRSSGGGTSTRTNSRRPRPTAVEYVSRMKLPTDRKRMLAEAAERFENKSFLPTSGDIRNFCGLYGVEQPVSGSRASAVPRLFKFMATMDPDELAKILRSGMFSGPARLGPIAEAIRNAGRDRIPSRVMRDGTASVREAAE